jgi:hypothetical protein
MKTSNLTNNVLQIQALSFTMDDDDDDDDENEDESEICGTNNGSDDKCEPPVRKKVRKNPDVDTSFLPDREREDEENRLREEYRQVSGIVIAASTRLCGGGGSLLG